MVKENCKYSYYISYEYNENNYDLGLGFLRSNVVNRFGSAYLVYNKSLNEITIADLNEITQRIADEITKSINDNTKKAYETLGKIDEYKEKDNIINKNDIIIINIIQLKNEE